MYKKWVLFNDMRKKDPGEESRYLIKPCGLYVGKLCKFGKFLKPSQRGAQEENVNSLKSHKYSPKVTYLVAAVFLSAM